MRLIESLQQVYYYPLKANRQVKACIQRNHIGWAFLVWVRFNKLAQQMGQTFYQLKHGLLDHNLYHQLKHPSLHKDDDCVSPS